jgi:Protein of unknown function (DUF4058)
MPSPFPEMDPYLEADRLWPLFQRSLVACLCWQFHPCLSPGYRACARRRDGAAGHVSEEYVEVTRWRDGRLVTLLDVVSPRNKTTDAGREAYLATRLRARADGASLVEGDLALQGRRALEDPAEGCRRSTTPSRSSERRGRSRTNFT